MSSPRKYEDILADILDKRQSRCVCPEEYLPPSPRSKPTTPCQFGPNCQFEMGTTCAYNAAECTCTQCNCGPLPPGCVCQGTCLCESEEALAPECDRDRCTCSNCTCRPDVSSPNLLPTSFRAALRGGAMRMMTDTEMREERNEIKRLIEDAGGADDKKAVTSSRSKLNDEDPPAKEEPRVPLEDNLKQSPKSSKTPKVSITLPLSTAEERWASRKSKCSKVTVSKKRKPPKKASTPKTPRSAVQYEYRVKKVEKKKPLKIRYYYAGGVESYGVKMGHRTCLPRPVSVPKNMGWLWNIEDPSKGIRERKGWPPGFIGKNIKNMIQVLKQFSVAEEGAPVGDGKEARRWKTQPDVRQQPADRKDEPPLLHIHKKGRTYNITFCPKDSDDDIGPVPIPFSITQKKQDDDDTDSSESTLEFELHSPKPRPRWNLPGPVEASLTPAEETRPAPSETKGPPSTKGRRKRKKSRVSDDLRNNWEDHPTQIENIPSSTVQGG